MRFNLHKVCHLSQIATRNLFGHLACITLLVSSSFTSQHALAAEKYLHAAEYKVLLNDVPRVELIQEIDKIIEDLGPDINSKVLIDLQIWKLQVLSKEGHDEAAAELANYIFVNYDQDSFDSEQHYGRSMYQVVESLAKTNQRRVAYDIIQHLRESAYSNPSIYLNYIIDKSLVEVYIETHDYEQALDVGQKMLQNTGYQSIGYARKFNASLLNEVAYLYTQLGDGKNALKYLGLASEAFEEDGLSPEKLLKARARNSGNLGRSYLLLKDYTKAEEMGREALAGGIKLKEYNLISLGHRLIGCAAYRLGDFEKALEALEAGIQVAEAKNIVGMKKPLYKEYAEVLEELGQYEAALLWKQKFFELEITDKNAQVAMRSNLNDAEFDAFKTYQELVTLRDENEAQREISARDKDVKKLLGFAVVSLLLGGGFLIYLLNYLSKSRKEIVRQANEVEAANDKLKMSALLDPLTNLPNRLAVKAHLNQQFRLAKKHDLEVAVAHIDFDHFKEINDKYGHPAGDFVLVEIAKRMKSWGKASNFVARIGGDEFLAVLSSDKNQKIIEESLQELLKLISKPINFEGITLPSSASIGVAVYPTYSGGTSELIVCADLALYEAKNNGRSQICFFDQKMLETLNSRKALEAELIVAISEGKISPFFQPQVNIATNKITGVEALIRWRHEKRGFISPDKFLPVAESSGLMVRLGRHVMEKAIREAAKWHALNISFGRLALNASASELHEDDFVDWILATAEKYDLPPNRLSIEIIETVMIKDIRLKLDDKLARIRNAGIRIELDDFGTGYASLQQLNADEIDGLKIDRSFIKNMQNEPCNAAIVSAIVELANTLNIDVVAEGAETFDELEALRALGCYTVQGFGIARPMPAEIVSGWMKVFQPKTNRETDEIKSVGTTYNSNQLRVIN